MAVFFFCHTLLSPTASIFRSGMPYAARTFLPHQIDAGDRTEALFSEYKITK